jgi:hypothetical protein
VRLNVSTRLLNTYVAIYWGAELVKILFWAVGAMRLKISVRENKNLGSAKLAL